MSGSVFLSYHFNNFRNYFCWIDPELRSTCCCLIWMPCAWLRPNNFWRIKKTSVKKISFEKVPDISGSIQFQKISSLFNRNCLEAETLGSSGKLAVPPITLKLSLRMILSCSNGEPSSARWQDWSHSKDVSFCLDKKIGRQITKQQFFIRDQYCHPAVIPPH